MEHRSTADDQQLTYLNDSTDYEVADGEPDVRGWSVETATGERLGTVSDMLVDTAQMKARYLEVELDDARGGSQQCTLVPIGAAQVQEQPERIVIDIESAAAAGLPRQAPRQRPTREVEAAVVACYREPARLQRSATSRGVHATAAGSATMPGAGGEPGKARDDEFYQTGHFDDSRFRRNRTASPSSSYLGRRNEPREDKPR